MSSMDIREPEGEPVSEIQFSEYLWLSKQNNAFLIAGEHGEEIDISAHDIDFLVKALQTAKKLWFQEVEQNTSK